MWHLNLAALTEAELLAMYGEQGLQSKLTELATARVQHKPLLDRPYASQLFGEPTEKSSFGSTPVQTRLIGDLTTKLHELGALNEETVSLIESKNMWGRGFDLTSDTAVCLRWNEEGQSSAVEVWLLSWLRDQVSGFSCVLTTNAAVIAPAYSHEIDVHIQQGELEELIQRHRHAVQRQGRTRKKVLSWKESWQQLHELNLNAWKYRKVIVETNFI